MQLSNEEKREILLSALCNSGHFAYGDMYVESDQDEFGREHCKTNIIEEIWMAVLENGRQLTIVDNIEAGEEHSFDLVKAYSQMDKLPKGIVADYLAGNDDADSADYVIETILFGEKIYG